MPMPTTMQETASIAEQLRALVRLQLIDTRIDQLEKLRGDLPEEIQDLEDEKTGLQTRLEKYKREAKEHEVERRRARLDIEEAETLIKRYEEQQLHVRNNREYDALTKEIEAQRQRIEVAKARLEELERLEQERVVTQKEAEERLQELEALLAAKRAELQAVLEDTKQEMEELLAKRAEAEQAVDPRYLRAYKRLRMRFRDGRAVVPLERGAAAGYTVPPQQQVEIRQRKRIIACEQTGRIIVDSELFHEVSQELGFANEGNGVA